MQMGGRGKCAVGTGRHATSQGAMGGAPRAVAGKRGVQGVRQPATHHHGPEPEPGLAGIASQHAVQGLRQQHERRHCGIPIGRSHLQGCLVRQQTAHSSACGAAGGQKGEGVKCPSLAGLLARRGTTWVDGLAWKGMGGAFVKASGQSEQRPCLGAQTALPRQTLWPAPGSTGPQGFPGCHACRLATLAAAGGKRQHW